MSSNILKNAQASSMGVDFDPTNKKHRAAYAFFTTNSRWPENMRFNVDWPSTSVVSTVERSLARHAIRSELKELDAATSTKVAA